MTQEDKELLFKDLCARSPYDVKVDYECNIYVLNEIDLTCKDIDYITVRIQDVERTKSIMIEYIKPYLRPMSSMTEEEEKEFILFTDTMFRYGKDNNLCCLSLDAIDWLNVHHFDYRNLIEKGLALEAPKEMYN